ncbi:hypothetical protein [Zoogloea sp.]|uniref:hypothetical protein n=1 Tax=Zoogloea sp. TaxID=49181 RepID=UPI001AC7A3C2|nr:hypothetical protein [Zoogloea sp.]MBN8283366.1 hypothetical protein [Zoogloea sp.]
MKKKLLAVGVAATLGALSGVSNAAITVAQNGVGHINILPYYSVQSGNTTLISIANTDEVNGKAVKVRFRGAQFSDDVFDFQVFLSPADVWTAAVTLDGTVARLATSDKSCTLPTSVNQQFVTARLLDANKAQGTREGYVEIINMGDIVSTANGGSAAQGALFTATKHVNGVAPCTSSVLVGTGVEPNDLTASLSAPTSGLTSFATIINVASSKAFTIPGTALVQSSAVPVRYARQANLTTGTASFPLIAFDAATTADSVFNTATGNVRMYEFDLPDLSTPYGTANVTAQLAELQGILAKGSVVTEYATADNILAATDVVLSQPTRRYYYTWTDTPAAGTDPLRTLATVAGATGPYASLAAATNSVVVGAPTVYDREERTVVDQSSIVISPNPQGSATWTLIGEVSVVSINNGSAPSGALKANITAQDYTFAYDDGLVRLSTTSANGPLPVIGFTAVNVFNSSVGASGTNYGQVLPLKW